MATHIDQVGTDLNGVFLDQDVNKDGAPDTKRDLDRIPDYDEPFVQGPPELRDLRVFRARAVRFHRVRTADIELHY